MTDREEAKLRGSVSECATERAYIYPDHDWVMHTRKTFSSDGRLLEKRHRNPDGSEWSILCHYDDGGRMLRKEQFTGNPSEYELLTYAYDSLGRLERVTAQRGSEERVCESVRYSADGTCTTTAYPRPLTDEQRRNTSGSGESALHHSPDAVAVMTLLDAHGRPVRRVLYDTDDRVIRRVAFRYNPRGLLAEEGEIIAGTIRPDFRNVYRYDDVNRMIEADRRWGDVGGMRRTFTYNERGDVIEENLQPYPGLPGTEHDLQPWAQRFSYRYDEPGNWIERRTETVLHTGEARLSMVLRRTLRYV